jgi:hypothetical protein
MNMVSDSADALRMNSVLLCHTTEIRPEPLSEFWVQDRSRSLVLKTQWTFRHEKVLPMAVIVLESPEQ